MGGLVKSIFGILGTGGIISPVPMAYVVISRNAYETLGKKQFNRGGPICSWKDGDNVYLVVYDSLKGHLKPGESGGILRFLHGYWNGDKTGKFWDEIRKNEKDVTNFIRWGDGKSGNGYAVGSALGEYGFSIYNDWGVRECNNVDKSTWTKVVDLVEQGKEIRLEQKNCVWGIISVECDISIKGGSVLNGRDGDKPTIKYSAF